MKRVSFVVWVLLLWVAGSAFAENEPVVTGSIPDSTRATFSLQINDIVTPHRTVAVFPMPGQELEFDVLFGRADAAYTFHTADGAVNSMRERAWRWQAPYTPGVYPLIVSGPADSITVTACVLTPYDADARRLEGYEIGRYAKKPYKKHSNTLPPPGLFRLTLPHENVRVSPHFTLADFQCKQPGDPKFVVVKPTLVLKLEKIVTELRLEGFAVSTLVVMSGYRTPAYNKRIGNKTTYSQHLFGSAADIYIDEDGDGTMDDLNGNGTSDRGDAQVLYNIIDRMGARPSFKPFLGGLSVYGPKPHRGPFVHVDVRGYRARW